MGCIKFWNFGNTVCARDRGLHEVKNPHQQTQMRASKYVLAKMTRSGLKFLANLAV
jgi:hypothetical protein